jgi:hypothetical protein
MSDQHGSMQPVRPLTRREIREREAAAAEQAGGAAPPAPGGVHTPPAQAGPPPSRRSMRDVSAPTPGGGYSSQAPIVRPPSMTGGMRGVDETGRLTPIQETAEHVPVRPAQSPPPGMAPPVRQSMRAPSTAPSPFGSTSRPVAHEPASQNAPSPFPPAQPATPFPPAQGGAPASRAQAPESPRAAAAPAPAPLPWEQSAPASGHAPQASEAARPSLPWETPAPAAAQASPFPGATEAAEQTSPFPGATGSSDPAEDSPFPAAAAAARKGSSGRRAGDQDEGEVDERPPGHAYTWLHYLILVAVAFVLGLLIWQLLLGEGGNAEQAASAVSGHVAALDHHLGLSS